MQKMKNFTYRMRLWRADADLMQNEGRILACFLQEGYA